MLLSAVVIHSFDTCNTPENKGNGHFSPITLFNHFEINTCETKGKIMNMIINEINHRIQSTYEI